MRRPWNLVDEQVYSLATYGFDSFNMNICTYVSPLSLKPKLYGIALYEGTKTLENIRESNYCVLQILRQSHIDLIKVLGKKSGNSFNKELHLASKNMLANWKGYHVLKDAAALVLLKRRRVLKTGDHFLCIFELEASKSAYEDQLLTTKKLIDSGLIL